MHPQVNVDFWQRHYFLFQYSDTCEQVFWHTVKIQMKSAIGSAEELGGSGVECLTPDEGLWVQALLSADFFFKIYPSKNSFRSTIRVSNSLNPDQDRQNCGPDRQNVVPDLAKLISKQQNSSENGCLFSTKLY